MHYLIFIFFVFNCVLFSSVPPTLEEWRMENQIQILEGHVDGMQVQQFEQLLQTHPEIKSVLEIGLNGGHSADIFLRGCKNLEKFVSFDICYWPYVQKIAEYFTLKYEEQFSFVAGNSRTTIPAFANNFPGEKFDLIFIDGDHSIEGCLSDIRNCERLAHENTLLLIDDYTYSHTVRTAINKCARDGTIKIDKIYPEGHGWVLAHYPFQYVDRRFIR